MTAASFDCISPIDGRKLATVAACDRSDVDRAVAGARASFERGDWAEQPPAERKRVLLRFADRIESATEELALLETLDVGKPIRDSLNVDVPATVRCLRWYAEAIDKRYDEVAPTASDTLALVTREPVGVVGAIVPWNFPMLMAAWKIAPVLAAGNSLVLKPSEKSPLSAIRLGQLALEAGVPAGVFQVLPGYGHTAGAALASHALDAIGNRSQRRCRRTARESFPPETSPSPACLSRLHAKPAWSGQGSRNLTQARDVIFVVLHRIERDRERKIGQVGMRTTLSIDRHLILF